MTNPTTLTDKILTRHDRGEKDVAKIAAALRCSPGHVYSVLREHRPDRARKPRKQTSDVPRMIAGMAKQGFKPPRVAAALGVSRAYVYRHWPD